jgi:hypothetical protein
MAIINYGDDFYLKVYGIGVGPTSGAVHSVISSPQNPLCGDLPMF